MELGRKEVDLPLVRGPRLISVGTSSETEHPLINLIIKSEIHLSVAFIRLTLEFYVDPGPLVG